MNTLIIAAHPDDEILGCGGTMAKLAREGSRVFAAVLGEGITSRYDRRRQAEDETVDRLAADSRRAAERVGVEELFFFGLPDNRFDTVPLLDVVKLIEGLISRLAPEAVYTQHGGDLNIDHGIVFRATITATRPVAGAPVKALYAYEVASATEWAFGQVRPRFQPNTFVDISDTLEAKIEAMKEYGGEIRDFPHPRSPEAITASARRWGAAVGCGAAEAFELIRAIQ